MSLVWSVPLLSINKIEFEETVLFSRSALRKFALRSVKMNFCGKFPVIFSLF